MTRFVGEKLCFFRPTGRGALCPTSLGGWRATRNFALTSFFESSNHQHIVFSSKKATTSYRKSVASPESSRPMYRLYQLSVMFNSDIYQVTNAVRQPLLLSSIRKPQIEGWNTSLFDGSSIFLPSKSHPDLSRFYEQKTTPWKIDVKKNKLAFEAFLYQTICWRHTTGQLRSLELDTTTPKTELLVSCGTYGLEPHVCPLGGSW